jgi:hypothetical protein
VSNILDSNGNPKPPIPLKRRFILHIDYPNSPAEIILNVMRYIVDENFAIGVSKEYMGEVRVEMQDEAGLQYRKYGRIVLQEIRQGLVS